MIRNSLVLWFSFGLSLTATVQGDVVLIGDSIVADVREPKFGWGELLPSFLDEDQFPVVNRASSGASSRSYYNQYWTSVGWPFQEPTRDIVNAGDFVMIEFGHNDLPFNLPEKAVADMDEYRSWLSTILTEVEELDAKAIFVTPPEGWAHRSTGIVGHIVQRQDHADTMKALAIETETPFIDLHAYSVELFGSISEEQAIADFEAVDPATGQPTGDKTHSSRNGAAIWAEFVAREFPAAVATYYEKDPGDFNQDGQLDLTDFLILSANYRETFEVPDSFLKGDSNLDGTIDLSDFLVFRREFISASEMRALEDTTESAVASVPEPEFGLRLGLGTLLLLVPLARRRRSAQ